MAWSFGIKVSSLTHLIKKKQARTQYLFWDCGFVEICYQLMTGGVWSVWGSSNRKRRLVGLVVVEKVASMYPLLMHSTIEFIPVIDGFIVGVCGYFVVINGVSELTEWLVDQTYVLMLIMFGTKLWISIFKYLSAWWLSWVRQSIYWVGYFPWLLFNYH